jgi:hypothetical protein
MPDRRKVINLKFMTLARLQPLNSVNVLKLFPLLNFYVVCRQKKLISRDDFRGNLKVWFCWHLACWPVC